MVRIPIDVDVDDMEMPIPYHKGRNTRPDGVPHELRSFIAWDGEGMNLNGPGKPQSYVLFGCSTGDKVKGPGLSTFQLLDFIIQIGEKHPSAIHCGFAFSYDSNMIVKSLHPRNLEFLHKNGYVKMRSRGHTYVIQMRTGKWFSVSRYEAKYDRKHNPTAKITVRIFDLFGFFTCSFVKAVEEMLGHDAPGMDIVREGKLARKEFAYDEMDYVEKYWTAEIELLRLVAEELRTRLWGAGLRITSWHGPGALASYSMKTHGIKPHMAVNNDAIREAARYAYAGGRFELYKAGRVTGPIYSLDINSAYPYAIAQLPSLSEGFWQYVENPKRVARFGVYRVRLHKSVGFDLSAGPLFHRDIRHNISYPWTVEGWYWSPEVAGLLNSEHAEVIEGWEYLGANSRPFAWVEDMYEQRREWKAQGNPQQLALKLCMNSLYGKMAQRVGWDEKRNRIPPWHQLEWAGWVTSYTRSMLYSVIRRIPHKALIAVETDGIYTTYPPDRLGIVNSKELGGWETNVYDELIYLQSGLAWLRQGETWTPKRRGLDADSLTLPDTIEYAKTLSPNAEWSPFVARSTRFIGLGAALNSGAPTKVKHCVWETNNREVMPGEKGKRIHFPGTCRACKQGANAYDMAHDLVIRSLSRAGEMTTPHNIPWEGKDDTVSEWREHAQRI